eukprot:1964694-Alexandrium_andersonii.AAC.1
MLLQSARSARAAASRMPSAVEPMMRLLRRNYPASQNYPTAWEPWPRPVWKTGCGPRGTWPSPWR